MLLSSTALMITGEVFLLLLAGCAFLFMQNRRLRALSVRLQDRMGELVTDLRESRSALQPEPALGSTTMTSVNATYAQSLEKQLAFTREYHQSQGREHDIALDLDMDTPAPRRIAALRYALLIAERDAQGDQTDEAPNWDKLVSRYQQLMDYYATRDSGDLPEDTPEGVETLKRELESYKKRVVNLEKFRQLYFELEARWNDCSEKAQSRYDELSEMASQLEESEAFGEALGQYHASYDSFHQIMEEDPATIVAESASARAAQQATGEIRHLRNVAADQHRLIYELQRKLEAATTQEEANDVITALQEELNKQLRYAQESETCIQLLEDELNTAHREAEQAREKMQQFGLIKAEYREMESHREKQDRLVLALKNENTNLKNKLRKLQKVQVDGTESQALKKELSELKVKYAELEERYLDLKLTN